MKATIAMILGLTVIGSTSLSAAQNGRGGGPPGRMGLGPQQFPPPITAAWDANKDGVLSAAEIKDSALALAKLDANNDRKLTADELCAGACPVGQRQGRVPVLLGLLDADKDGALSPEEAAQAPALLLKFDANKDGQLTPDELRPLPGCGQGGRGGGNRGNCPFQK